MLQECIDSYMHPSTSAYESNKPPSRCNAVGTYTRENRIDVQRQDGLAGGSLSHPREHSSVISTLCSSSRGRASDQRLDSHPLPPIPHLVAPRLARPGRTTTTRRRIVAVAARCSVLSFPRPLKRRGGEGQALSLRPHRGLYRVHLTWPSAHWRCPVRFDPKKYGYMRDAPFLVSRRPTTYHSCSPPSILSSPTFASHPLQLPLSSTHYPTYLGLTVLLQL